MFLRNIGDMFGGGNNPADSAMPYFNQIPDILKQYLGPYSEAGQKALPNLQSQYGMLMGNPGDFLNKMGQGYQKSPGFDFAVKQAEGAAGRANAAGGMAGTPQHEQQVSQMVTNLANQDYNQWLSNALGLYGRSLGGEENIFNVGAHAGSNLGENLASNMMNQGGLAFQGQANQNAQNNDMMKMMMNAAMMAAFL